MGRCRSTFSTSTPPHDPLIDRTYPHSVEHDARRDRDPWPSPHSLRSQVMHRQSMCACKSSNAAQGGRRKRNGGCHELQSQPQRSCDQIHRSTRGVVPRCIARHHGEQRGNRIGAIASRDDRAGTWPPWSSAIATLAHEAPKGSVSSPSFWRPFPR